MNKKLTKHGNSLALVIEKPILNLLKIDAETNLDITIDGDALVVRAATKKKRNTQEQEANIDTLAQRIMEKYAPVFNQLANNKKRK